MADLSDAMFLQTEFHGLAVQVCRIVSPSGELIGNIGDLPLAIFVPLRINRWFTAITNHRENNITGYKLTGRHSKPRYGKTSVLSIYSAIS